MILVPHLIISAIIAAKLNSLVLVAFFALLFHYILDFIPHKEYSIMNIKERSWKKSLPDFIKLGFDLIIGLSFVLLIKIAFNVSYLKILVAIFFGTLPDFLGFLGWFIKENNILKKHSILHTKKIHFLKHKKIPAFWRISSQIIVILIGFLMLH